MSESLSTEACESASFDPTLTATYSPDDNKLRLYSVTRLPEEVYERVRAAGFRFAPKRELFVAPMWTPERADLLLELCGEIGDEDRSLVERAEERAERFEDYGERRADDAEAARTRVESIAGGIPLGQPILVGHHSERRARRDAKRIEQGMRKAVTLWQQSEYWTRRAEGALRHAKYKELPGVRHRRIKTLEAETRKQDRAVAAAERFRAAWSKEDLTREAAMRLANFDHVRLPAREGESWGDSLWSALDKERMGPADAARHAIAAHGRVIARAERWIEHLSFRLVYERAMLGEVGGIAADRFDIQPGGRVLVRGEWCPVLRVTRRDGKLSSLRVLGRFGERLCRVERVVDYQAPAGDAVEQVKEATNLPPLVNFSGEGVVSMTQAEWKARPNDFKSVRVVAATEANGRHRRRQTIAKGGGLAWVFITDAKRSEPPPASPQAKNEGAGLASEPAHSARERRAAEPDAPNAFDAMKEQLKGGVSVLVADALFPTPPELVERVIEAAEIQRGDRVLEPSAGTGMIAKALAATPAASVTTVEIHPGLAKLTGARCADFLSCDDLGPFERVVMNPPFAEEIDHVVHAFSMLAPGGRLVAVMSAGVTFHTTEAAVTFRAFVGAYGRMESLPDKSFAVSGTNVRTVLVVLDRPREEALHAAQ